MLGNVSHEVVVQEMDLSSPLIKKELKRQKKLCNQDHHEPGTVSSRY